MHGSIEHCGCHGVDSYHSLSQHQANGNYQLARLMCKQVVVVVVDGGEICWMLFQIDA